MKIIERMLSIMNDKNLKAKELAEYLNVRQSVVSTWKTRATNPPAEYIIQICEFLNVEPYFLLTGKNVTRTQSEIEIIYEQLNEEYKIIAKHELKKLIKEQHEENNKDFKSIG